MFCSRWPRLRAPSRGAVCADAVVRCDAGQQLATVPVRLLAAGARARKAEQVNASFLRAPVSRTSAASHCVFLRFFLGFLSTLSSDLLVELLSTFAWEVCEWDKNCGFELPLILRVGFCGLQSRLALRNRAVPASFSRSPVPDAANRPHLRVLLLQWPPLFSPRFQAKS